MEPLHQLIALIEISGLVWKRSPLSSFYKLLCPYRDSVFANDALDYTQAHSRVEKVTDGVEDG